MRSTSRARAPTIAGVASFHGLFDPPGLPPRPIKAKVAAYHGWDDPLVPPEAVVALAAELTAAGADWQIHAFGHVGHGFTNPGATGAMPGIKFDETHRAAGVGGVRRLPRRMLCVTSYVAMLRAVNVVGHGQIADGRAEGDG